MEIDLPTFSFPHDLRSRITRIEEVSDGIHQTVRCYFEDDSICYLKMALAQNNNLRVELSVTEFLSQHLAGREHIPTVVWVADDQRQFMTSQLTGRKATADDIVVACRTLLELLSQIHDLPVDTIALPTWSIENLQNDIVTIPGLLKKKWQIDQRFEAVMALNLKTQSCFLGLVHGDLNSGNVLFVKGQNKWQLLDWECAQHTDVRWDLASIVIEFDLDEIQSQRIFSDYAKTINANVEKFQQDALFWIQFYKLTCLCWALKNDHPIQRYL